MAPGGGRLIWQSWGLCTQRGQPGQAQRPDDACCWLPPVPSIGPAPPSVSCYPIWAVSQVPLPGNLLAARLSKEWSFTPLGEMGNLCNLPFSLSPALSPGPFLPLMWLLIPVLAAFVPAPPVAPVPAPAPMPPVHPPPPMEDEPASKKLKTEDSLMPEEEFLRRNKVCISECCPQPGVSRWAGAVSSPTPVTRSLAHPILPWFWLLGPGSAIGGP